MSSMIGAACILVIGVAVVTSALPKSPMRRGYLEENLFYNPDDCFDVYPKHMVSLAMLGYMKNVFSLKDCMSECLNAKRKKCLSFDFIGLGVCFIYSANKATIGPYIMPDPYFDHYERLIQKPGC